MGRRRCFRRLDEGVIDDSRRSLIRAHALQALTHAFAIDSLSFAFESSISICISSRRQKLSFKCEAEFV
jgi:hypothetical protein